MAIPNKRVELSSAEKHRSFRGAFDVIAQYRAEKNYLAAFVIAFSVFEDRLTAAVMSAAELAGEATPGGHLPLYKRLNRLVRLGHLDTLLAENMKKSGDERNAVLHAAMWNFNAVSDDNVAAAVVNARAIDKIASRLRRAVLKRCRTGR